MTDLAYIKVIHPQTGQEHWQLTTQRAQIISADDVVFGNNADECAALIDLKYPTEDSRLTFLLNRPNAMSGHVTQISISPVPVLRTGLGHVSVLLDYVKEKGEVHTYDGSRYKRSIGLGLQVAPVEELWGVSKVTYSARAAAALIRKKSKPAKPLAPAPLVSMYTLQSLHTDLRKMLPGLYQKQFLRKPGARKEVVMDNLLTVVTFFNALYGKSAHRKVSAFQDFLEHCRKTPRGVAKLAATNKVFHDWLIYELAAPKPKALFGTLPTARHLPGIQL